MCGQKNILKEKKPSVAARSLERAAHRLQKEATPPAEWSAVTLPLQSVGARSDLGHATQQRATGAPQQQRVGGAEGGASWAQGNQAEP